VSVITGGLAETFDAIGALDPYLRAVVGDIPPDPGWLATEAETHLERCLESIGRAWKTDDRRVQAAFFINDYVWRVGAPAIAAFLSARRVPVLDRDAVVMQMNADAEWDAPVFLSDSFTGRSGDSVAAEERADDDLLRLLRCRIEDHMTPLVASVRAAAPLGVRAQWALIGDACGSSFLHAGEALADPSDARRWAERFLALDGRPLRAKQTFFVLEHAGKRSTFMVRGACCLSYQIGENPYCATCPLTSQVDRERQLRDWMASPD
jgi:ferric iron reductase protein FhuF